MRFAAILLTLALAGGAVPALAQSETGTRLGGRPAQLPDRGSAADRARVWMERYAACIVRRDPKRVADLLDGAMGDDGPMDKLVQGGIYDDCLSTGGGADELALNHRLLRGALYADRVAAQARRIAPSLPGAAPLAYPAVADAQAGLVRFGECVVRANPAAALGFVSAKAATDAEKSHLVTLRPALGGCITSGQTIQLSASVLEAALAEAIWRMTQRAGA